MKQTEPVNHHCIYASCAWASANLRKCSVSRDCDLAKETKELHTKKRPHIDLTMITTGILGHKSSLDLIRDQ